MKSANYWIDKLELLPHPEGGFYKETYRAGETVPHAGLPKRFGGARSMSTGIYFLLRDQDISHFHRIASDEMWHFYAGSSLTVHMIDEAGNYNAYEIGANPDTGQTFQTVVPAGVWFGASVDKPDSYALVGCTVAPGFDFEDFEMATREGLQSAYPQHADIIRKLTKT